jgi:hypothetical protein
MKLMGKNRASRLAEAVSSKPPKDFKKGMVTSLRPGVFVVIKKNIFVENTEKNWRFQPMLLRKKLIITFVVKKSVPRKLAKKC